MAADGRRPARRPRIASRAGSGANAARYVEWEAISNYSFLRGASHPEELVRRAADLDLGALGVADHDTLAGAVRVHTAARAAGLESFVGARLDLADAPPVLAYPCDRAAWGRLSRLLTEGKARAGGGTRSRSRTRDAGPARGEPEAGAGVGVGVGVGVGPRPRPEAGAGLGAGTGPGASPGPTAAGTGAGDESGGRGRGEGRSGALRAGDLLAAAEGMVLIVLPPPDRPDPDLAPLLSAWRAAFPGQVWLALRRWLASPPNDAREERVVRAARSAGVPLVATNAVLMHRADRRPVADVLACLRTGRRIDEMGLDLLKNAERRLKSPAEMAHLFRDRPEAIEATVDIAGRIGFSLDQLRLDYPDEAGPDGRSALARLEQAVRKGAAERYPSGVPAPVESQLERELGIIARLGYASYFLTVHDLVRFARSRGILAQGRGSAANSAVCYVLGITAVDPARNDLLFERFVSEERGEPPDIDVDFEHERREEVIQHVYERWGRHRAALTATVTHFRARLALREAGKALGLSEEVTSVLAAQSGGEVPGDEAVRALGLDPEAPRLRHALAVARTLVGFPRHLSQHPGGFVIGQGRLDEVVPIGPAAMPGRTVIEWDKDDLEALGILKVDVLGLGMLSCLRKGFELLASHHGRRLDLAGIPPEDPAVYDMLCRADSLGVFQVESRAQMSFLPRMKPRILPRSRDRGGDRAPGPHPGRDGPSLPAPAQRAGGGPLSAAGARAGPGQDPGGAHLPGAGDADRDHRGRVHAGGSGRTAPVDGDLPAGRHPAAVSPPLPRTAGGARLRSGVRRAVLAADRGVRGVRLPREPRGELRDPGVRLGLAQVPLPGRVRLRAPQQPADGLLRPGPDRARRARARGGGAAGRRQRERVGLDPGGVGGGRRVRASPRFAPCEGARGGARPAGGGGARQRLPRAGRRAPPGRSRGAGDDRPRRRGRVRFARSRAAGGMVGGRADQGAAAPPLRGRERAGSGAGLPRSPCRRPCRARRSRPTTGRWASASAAIRWPFCKRRWERGSPGAGRSGRYAPAPGSRWPGWCWCGSGRGPRRG